MATVRKRGGKWQVQVRRDGHTPQSKTFTRKCDAEAWGRDREIEIARGDAVVDPKRLRELTLADLLRRYGREVTPRKKSRGVELCYLRALAAHPIGLTTINKLTTERLAAYRDERLQTVLPSSLRREFNVLRHCLQVAISEWHVGLQVNPLTGLRLPANPPSRERRLKDEELQALKTALSTTRNSLMASVVSLAIYTGMRRSELLRLRWRNVDLERGLAFLPDTKNGRPRLVPLSPQARSVLAGLSQGSRDDLVLPMSANAVRLSWERLRRRAGITDLHFHDLRHEAISRFFEAGLSVPEVSLISGHRDPRMLLRYTHLRPESVADRLAHLAGHT